MKQCSPKTYLGEAPMIISMIIFVRSILVVGQPCQNHESKIMDRCCIAVTVNKGYQPVICDTEGGFASSEPCPPDTFQPDELSSLAFRLCERHSTCQSPNLITVRNGNSTSDTICQCNVSGGYHDNRSVRARSAQPLQSYHCQYSPSVTSASSGYPAQTSSSITTSALDLAEMPSSIPPSALDPAEMPSVHLIWIACVVIALAIGVTVVVVACIVCYKRKLIEKVDSWCSENFRECLCKQRNNETIVEMDPTSIPLNEPMPNRNNAADTDAPLPLSVIESSNVPVENDNGYDMSASMQDFSLHEDSVNDNSSYVPSSLCAR